MGHNKLPPECNVREIRAKVMLTNAADEMRCRSGTLSGDRMRSIEVDAVVDSDSIFSAIPSNVLEKLGVAIRRGSVLRTARTESAGMTEPILFDVFGRNTIDEAMVFGDEVRIGRTVLAKLDILVDSATQRLVPNPFQPSLKLRPRR